MISIKIDKEIKAKSLVLVTWEVLYIGGVYFCLKFVLNLLGGFIETTNKEQWEKIENLKGDIPIWDISFTYGKFEFDQTCY